MWVLVLFLGVGYIPAVAGFDSEEDCKVGAEWVRSYIYNYDMVRSFMYACVKERRHAPPY